MLIISLTDSMLQIIQISYLEMPNHTYKLRMQINFTSHFIEARAT